MKNAILILFSLGFCLNSWAKPEDWYWGLNLGTGDSAFAGSKNTSINTLSANPSFSVVNRATELFLYFPSYRDALLGVVIGGATKTFIHTNDNSQNQTFGQSLMTISWLESLFGTDPVTGLLLKADIGYGTIFQTTGTSFLPNSGSETGLALRAGAGYGFAWGENTRVLIMATAATTYSEGRPTYYAISVGPLF